MELKVYFSLEEKEKGKKLYEREVDLLPFQNDVMEGEKSGLFYFFKDQSFEIEEKLIPKISTTGEGNVLEDIFFRVVYKGDELFSYKLDNESATSEDFSTNEVEVFYFFETIVKKFIQKLMETHKQIVLYKNE